MVELGRRWKPWRLALATFLLVLLAAATGAAKPAVLVVEAMPTLGPSPPSGERWLEISVRLINPGEQQVEGTVELSSEMPWSGSGSRVVTHAPFAVAGKGRVTLELPTHGFFRAPPHLRVAALDAAGNVLGAAEVAEPRAREPMLFDLTVPSRIGPGLRGARVATQNVAPLRGTYGAPALAVASPSVNPATGDPVLPDRSAGYAAATVVLTRGDRLAALTGEQLDALVSWVLGGGALAVVITRPEDVRSATLKAMLAGEPVSGKPAAALLGEASFVVPYESPYGSGGSGYGTPRTALRHATPGAAVQSALVGWTGGNLRQSPWGASASYGLGEVHLLAFDATQDPAASDEWAKFEMLDLIRHAWDRSTSLALPHGGGGLDSPELDAIRRQLDPNEGARWAVVVALLVLILYSVLAGPLNFHLAAKKGRPLRALWHLPIWAGATMGLVVLLGVIAKGVFGRARHLTLIEAGAGMTRAPITRFRGFYSSSAEQLLVRAGERGNVLDVAGELEGTSRTLVVDRDGARLERFQVKPWQTLVVREDGFTSLGGGVSIVSTAGGQVEVANRAARDLIGAILWRPGASAVYFPRIADGKTVKASEGKPLSKKIGRLRYHGGVSLRQLDADEFGPTLEPDVKGAGAAWAAFSALVDPDVDWWPDDVPVLIAQLEGGEGKSSDSGLRIDSDRVLLRVVGYGGVP